MELKTISARIPVELKEAADKWVDEHNMLHHFGSEGFNFSDLIRVSLAFFMSKNDPSIELE